MGRFGLYLGAAILAASAADFAANSPVCGYVAKTVRETIQNEQPDNVRVGYKFGETVLSDRTVGRVVDGTFFGLEAAFMASAYAKGKYKKKETREHREPKNPKLRRR